MLTYTLVAGVGLLGWLTVRHLRGRRAPMVIGLLIIALVAGGLIEVRWRAMEHRYSEASREVLGRDDTHVVCQRLTNALFDVRNRAGHVDWTGDDSLPRRADLTWDTCRDLRGWEGDGRTADDLAQVTAVHVLTHEIMHLDGYYNEAEAECAAMQHDAEVARLLGATSSNAAALARSYWRTVYPRMRSDYVSGDCREGGALDQSPDDGTWP